MKKYIYLFIVLFLCFIGLRTKTTREGPPQANLVQALMNKEVSCDQSTIGLPWADSTDTISEVGYCSSSGITWPMSKIPETFKNKEYITESEVGVSSKCLILINNQSIVRIRGDGQLYAPIESKSREKFLTVINLNYG